MDADAEVSADQAVQLHQAGDIAGAARAYRQLLSRDPRNGQLLNLLGVAHLQMGEAKEATQLLKEAARQQPESPDIQDNLGSAMRAAGSPAIAVEAHRKALKLRPDHPPYLYNLGNALAALGMHRQAIDAYRRSLHFRPDHVGALFNLANSQRDIGDMSAAAAGYRALLAIQPVHAAAWNNLGAALASEGELLGAERAYRQSLAVRPGHAETLSNLGNVLVERGKLGEAVECHHAAVTADPGRAEGHIFLGVALQEIDEIDAAISSYRQGLQLDPDNIQGLTNLGAALEQAGQLSEAETTLSRALVLAPQSADVWGNIGMCRLAQGDRDRGMAALDRALQIEPDLARARITRALLLLETGDLAAGWRDYAWRFAAGEALPDRRFAVPKWRGEAREKQSLLIWREQGLGDELMFASLYPAVLAGGGGKTIVECDPRLVGLFTRSFPDAMVRQQYLPPDDDLPERPDTHLHVPAGDLPALLSPNLTGFTGAPYLIVDPARSTEAKAWLDGLPPGLRVGICWRSRMVTTRRRHNYVPASDWAPLLALPDIQVINLQYTARCEEIAALQEGGRILHTAPGLDLMNDLEGLAALIANLDLVVTAPTAVGELAGALGTPVWRVAGAHDWSTLGAGIRPWFASMRLFAHSSGVKAGIENVIRFLGQFS